MLIHSKHNLCQLCCCPDTGCKGMKKNVFDKNPPPQCPSYLYFIKDFQVVENGFTPLPSPLKIRLSERRRSLFILPSVRILSKGGEAV